MAKPFHLLACVYVPCEVSKEPMRDILSNKSHCSSSPNLWPSPSPHSLQKGLYRALWPADHRAYQQRQRHHLHHWVLPHCAPGERRGESEHSVPPNLLMQLPYLYCVSRVCKVRGLQWKCSTWPQTEYTICNTLGPWFELQEKSRVLSVTKANEDHELNHQWFSSVFHGRCDSSCLVHVQWLMYSCSCTVVIHQIVVRKRCMTI